MNSGSLRLKWTFAGGRQVIVVKDAWIAFFQEVSFFMEFTVMAAFHRASILSHTESVSTCRTTFRGETESAALFVSLDCYINLSAAAAV